MPSFAVNRKWTVPQIEQAMTRPHIILPLGQNWNGYDFVRASDGFGVYAPGGEHNAAEDSVFCFRSGEIWSTNAFLVTAYRAANNALIAPVLASPEKHLIDGLNNYMGFLESRLEIDRPYTWIAGIEGIKGMRLSYPPPPNSAWAGGNGLGGATVDSVELRGEISIGQSAKDALKPFLEELFGAFALERPSYLDSY
jgi:hypothetical protein